MMIPSGYKETEIGVIPEDWDVKHLEPAIGKVKSGKRLPKGYSVIPVPNEHPYIRVLDMEKGRINTSNIMYVPDEVYPLINNYRIFKHDIYISVAGTLGIVGRIPLELDGANLTENANRITNINCNINYLMYWLMSDEIQQSILDAQTQGAQPKLALYQIRNFPVPIPAPKEQDAIAEALSDIDDLIFSLEKLIEKKKAVKQGAMQDLLSGKKRLPGFNGEWEIRSIGSMCTLVTKQTGFDYSSTIQPNLKKGFIASGMPMLQTKNFRGTRFEYETDYYLPNDIVAQFPKIILDTPCLLFSIVGASVGNIGLFLAEKTMFCGGAIGIAKFADLSMLKYSYYYMCSKDGQEQIKNVTKGAAQATVTIEDIRKFLIPMPDVDERTQITELLSNMDSEIESLESKLAKYRKIKQGMMQQLLTGQIRLV